ncbi:MAG: S41 family peptidase [Sphingomonas sp.]
MKRALRADGSRSHARKSIMTVRPILLSMLLTLSLLPMTAPGTAAVTAVPAATLDATMRKKVIDGAIAQMRDHYVFPAKVPVIAKALERALASGKYNSLNDPEQFVAAVNDDIERVANDRHLRLEWSADPLPPPPEPGKIDPAMKRMMDERMARVNYGIRKIEVLDGNIGYLKIDGFPPAEMAGRTFAAAMAVLKHADAMIIDLRENGGGDPQMVALAMSYLVPPRTLINTFHQRDKAVNDQIWSLPYVPGDRWSTDKPVYVLASKQTASGGEEMAYDVQQLKRGTVVGEATWGGANPGAVEPIDDHFVIFVPFGMAVNPVSGTNWEGSGVQPDVPTPASEALRTARTLALKTLLAKATGERRDELQKLLEPQATGPGNSP